MFLITWRFWFGFSLIISRRSYKETFRRGPHNVNTFNYVAEGSEVALFEKTFVIFTIKSMMHLRRFRLSLEETKAYSDCVNCSCRKKMSYALARSTHDDVRVVSSRDFL